MAVRKNEIAARLFRDAERQQETEQEDSTARFPQYLKAKAEYQDSRTSFRKVLKKVLLERGSAVASVLVNSSLHPHSNAILTKKVKDARMPQFCAPSGA